MTYTARSGSLTEKAIGILAANAGDPLTRQQIAAGVGCNPASVEGLLDTAVKHGAVKKHTDFGTYRWSVPKGTVAVPPQVSFAAAVAAHAEQSKATPADPAETPSAEKPQKVKKAKKAGKAKPARKAKPAKRAFPKKRAVKRAVRRAFARDGEAAPAPIETESPLPAFGLYSDGSLEMKRDGVAVFCIDYLATLGLIRYLVSQKALVDELFPQGTGEAA